jgi:hypothetical protein
LNVIFRQVIGWKNLCLDLFQAERMLACVIAEIP